MDTPESSQTPAGPPATPLRRLGVKSKRAEDILMWRDPRASATALSGATAAFLLLRVLAANVVASAAWLALAAVLGAFLWNNVAALLHRRPLPVPALLREGVSAAQAADWAERARPRVNRALLVGHRLASGRDPPATGIAVALLYATARAATLSLTGLAYGALLALFTLPKWYEMHQDKVDAAADRVRIQATRVYDRHVHPLVKRIPKYRPPSGPAESSAARKEE